MRTKAYAKHRVLPSHSAIGSLVGLRSKASVAEMLMRLKAEGFVQSTPERRLKPGRRFFERPVAEHVRAGHPAMALDSGHEGLSIDEYLVANPARTVLIRVKGDSMIDAGIHSGDTVVVEKRSSANVGDNVVAIIDNELTLKRLGREKGQIVLRPENKAYPVIRPKGDVEIRHLLHANVTMPLDPPTRRQRDHRPPPQPLQVPARSVAA